MGDRESECRLSHSLISYSATMRAAVESVLNVLVIWFGPWSFCGADPSIDHVGTSRLGRVSFLRCQKSSDATCNRSIHQDAGKIRHGVLFSLSLSLWKLFSFHSHLIDLSTWLTLNRSEIEKLLCCAQKLFNFAALVRCMVNIYCCPHQIRHSDYSSIGAKPQA